MDLKLSCKTLCTYSQVASVFTILVFHKASCVTVATTVL